MTRVRNCAVCKNSMMLDFQEEIQEAVCPHCGAVLRYRLLDRFMFQIISDTSTIIIPQKSLIVNNNKKK